MRKIKRIEYSLGMIEFLQEICFLYLPFFWQNVQADKLIEMKW